MCGRATASATCKEKPGIINNQREKRPEGKILLFFMKNQCFHCCITRKKVNPWNYSPDSLLLLYLGNVNYFTFLSTDSWKSGKRF